MTWHFRWEGPAHWVLERAAPKVADVTAFGLPGLGFCGFFVMLELIELLHCGPVAYFLNMWNVMDWINFAVFFLVWWTLRTMFEQEANRPCALLCQTVRL